METEKMVTRENLASINQKLPPQEKLIIAFNPNAARPKEQFITRKNFDKVHRHKGWIEIGANEDISEVLMKNRPRTPAEIVLEEENRKLREMLAQKNNGQPENPPTFSLSNDSQFPPFNLERTVPEITAEVNTVERVATLNEIMAAETSGQNRKGVISAIENRINEIGK